jgi:hypothetical protein
MRYTLLYYCAVSQGSYGAANINYSWLHLKILRSVSHPSLLAQALNFYPEVPDTSYV